MLSFVYCKDSLGCAYKHDHTGMCSNLIDKVVLKMLDEEEDKIKGRIERGEYDIIMNHKMYTNGYNVGIIRGWEHARKFLRMERK